MFDGSEEPVGDPVLHQQWELAVIVSLVFEHARVRLLCPECQRTTLAALSAGAGSGFGPRLDAHIAMLAGVFRLSRDQVCQVVAEVFGIPACTGSIDSAIMRMSAILRDPWPELKDAIATAQAVHLDETTWRLGGAQQWLWVAASALVACYRIDPSRSQQAAKALVGEAFGGFAITDRYAGYHFLEVLRERHKVCVRRDRKRRPCLQPEKRRLIVSELVLACMAPTASLQASRRRPRRAPAEALGISARSSLRPRSLT